MDKNELTNLLKSIDPSTCDYQEWVNVGMALKEEGLSAQDWDEWSSHDLARYKPGECYIKWSTFLGDTNNKVTGGTIYQMAKDRGWSPQGSTFQENKALDWDAVIGVDEGVVIKPGWVEGIEVKKPESVNSVSQICEYLSTLFSSDEYVGYCVQAIQDEKDKRWKPASKGSYKRTSGELIRELQKCKGDFGAVLGDYNKDAGAWIRFNPLDGEGVKNANVASFRYALVESDNLEIEKQNALLRELELPIAILVHSGGKSLHAIVRIDAGSYEEYRKRVDFLYKICKKNGLTIDEQNKNPSRLSRLPGVHRGENMQFIVASNIGHSSWNEWKEWIDSVNDDLPDPVSLGDKWNNMPPLAPALIDGVLRQGHKMLIAGPSKAGKSYLMIELCIAIAEGYKWIGWPCTQGKVLYVNLELDEASCFHRFQDVYKAMNLKPDNVNNINIWNLRGKTLPMDKLAPKLIRRAIKEKYIAIMIDPIYKVITGDENSAEQMANFTNQFDKLATELGSSVIYCHHHSKGYQGNKKAMDRASGSGVFARDPDALLDLTELDVSDSLWKAEENKVVCRILSEKIKSKNISKYNDIGQDDFLSSTQMKIHAEGIFKPNEMVEVNELIEKEKVILKRKTAWRIDGILREFPKFDPVNIWFNYPCHIVDDTGTLKDLEPEGEVTPWKKAMENRKSPEKKKEERVNALEIAFANLELDDEPITVDDLAEEMGVSKRTVWNRINEHGGFKTEKKDDKKSYVTRIDE